MLVSPLLLLALPLAAARPHLPGAGAMKRREHHARAAVTDRPLVERAGAAISNETRDEISSWRHAHESDQQSTVVTSASAAASGVANVGNALTAVSSYVEPSAAPTSAAQTQAPESQTDAASSAEPSVVEAAPSQDSQPSTAEAAAASASPSPSAVESSAELISSASPSSRSSITQTTVVTASRSSTVVRVTASSSASASAAASNNDEPEKIAGLNKTTFIIIIVVAGALAVVAVGWTVFRKWKLRPSSRFDEKMRPIDFSPDNGADPLYSEKSHGHHMRTGSNSSAAMHRQELVAELDSKHVPGVPDHDFTAGGGANMAGHGAYDVYNQDPYAHAEAYEYDAAYHYDQRGYEHDQPTQDNGYADLQRGNSIGSGSGHGHGQQYPIESFPVADHYLSRPSAADGPYAASRY